MCVTCLCDRRVTKCQFWSFSVIDTRTQSASNELQFDVSFKTVRIAKVKLGPQFYNARLVVVEWSFSRKWS